MSICINFHSSEINWKSGKNVMTKAIKKKQKKKGKYKP